MEKHWIYTSKHIKELKDFTEIDNLDKECAVTRLVGTIRNIKKANNVIRFTLCDAKNFCIECKYFNVDDYFEYKKFNNSTCILFGIKRKYLKDREAPGGYYHCFHLVKI